MPTPKGDSSSPGNYPPGCWYYNKVTGSTERQCNPLLVPLLTVEGYFGNNGLPAGWDNAFSTEQAARQAGQSDSAGGIIGQAESWTDTVGNFFSLLTSRQTLIRLAEGLIGIGLVVGGLLALANARLESQASKVGITKSSIIRKAVPR